MRMPILFAQHESVLRQTEVAAFLEQATMKSVCKAAARGSITTLRLSSWAELLLKAFQSNSIGKQAMTNPSKAVARGNCKSATLKSLSSYHHQ